MTDILQVENMSLRRGGCEILRHLNLAVRAGEVHALLGLNGSGKSSLAYALMGCAGYTPDAGRIVFDGRDVTALGISERARLGITLAWQEPARFEGLPVAQYVQLGMANADPSTTPSAPLRTQIRDAGREREPGARRARDRGHHVRGGRIAARSESAHRRRAARAHRTYRAFVFRNVARRGLARNHR